MSFLGFGNKNKVSTVALFDISSSSIGAGYARVAPGAPTEILYTTRIPIDSVSGDIPTPLMLRTLDMAIRSLRESGAPLLRRQTGTGSVQQVLVQVGAPWQKTEIKTETVTEEKPFVFSESLIEKAKKEGQTPKGMLRTESTVLATVLNGYETPNPVGKHIQRAEIVVLDAFMEAEGTQIIRRALGTFIPLHAVQFSTFTSVISSTLRLAFPHEKDYLALRVSGEATELVFVRRGFPVFVSSLSQGLNQFVRTAKSAGLQSIPSSANLIDQTKNTELTARLAGSEKEWTDAIINCLQAFAATHALPRTMFLLADSDSCGFIHRVLDIPSMHALWLSDEPLAIIDLEAKHFGTTITFSDEVENDMPLALLALRAQT